MKICLSIGYPIKYSLSPVMHNSGYKKLGLNNEFTFQAAEVKPSELKAAVLGIRALGIRGVSVTMPHKQTVIKFLDKVDKDAQIIGAVNTILNEKGRLIGFNTDYIGAIEALEKRVNLKNKKVAVLGAGGAARAIVYGLVKNGAKVKIFNRSKQKAKILAKNFGCEFSNLNNIEEVTDMDIIINATSVGMNEDKSPLDKKLLKKSHIIFDIITSHKETKFIKDAKAVGARVIYGYEMLLYQGVAQFKLYTGIDAPVEAMKKALEESL